MGLLPSKTTPSPSPSPPLNGTTPSPPTPPDGTTSAPSNGTTPSPPNGTTPSPPTSPNGTTSAPSNGTTPSPPTPPDGTTSAPPNGTTPSPPTFESGPEFEQKLMRWRPDYDYVLGLAKYQGMSMVKMNFFLDWVVGDKKSPVHWHAPVVPGEQRFPLVIFSHGISGSRFVYTTVCASLASHGYVVAALEHRDGSCCWTYTLEPVPTPTPPPSPPLPKPMEMRILPHDETEYETRIDQVKRRVAETVHMRRILAEMDANLLQNAATDNNNDRQFGQQQILLGQTFDWTQFKNRLALDRCVCMGHSFGAASSLSACAEYPSLFNACVLLDAWLYPVERRMYPATVQPVLMLNASKWQWPRNVRRMQRLLSTETTTTPPQQSQDAKNITTTATTEANAPPSVTNTDSRMMFTIKDIVHQSFSDFGFLVPGRVARYIGVQGDLDPLLTGTAVLEMVLQFLEAQFLHQQQQKEEDDEEDTEEEDESEEEEKEEEGEKESNERGGGEERNEKGEQQDEVAKSNVSALDRLRRLVAEKYATFVVEGTDFEFETKGETELSISRIAHGQSDSGRSDENTQKIIKCRCQWGPIVP
ncbi:hypothetical protein niasHT_028554 [Heterodera trifolii]|uniref:1-alkyl-2-acetylglycerophosphocholine esterase n=1 Tax=Heterodera trifolii TaxID=157864 RepID=A0ABD2JP33_9BILA